MSDIFPPRLTLRRRQLTLVEKTSGWLLLSRGAPPTLVSQFLMSTIDTARRLARQLGNRPDQARLVAVVCGEAGLPGPDPAFFAPLDAAARRFVNRRLAAMLAERAPTRAAALAALATVSREPAHV